MTDPEYLILIASRNAEKHPADAARLRKIAEQFHIFQQEIIAMARTFAEASAILIQHDKDQAAIAASEKAQVDTLTSQLATATTNASTPEVLAAQQAVIDAAAAAVPEATAAVTSAT